MAMGTIIILSKNIVRRHILSTCIYNEYFRRDLMEAAAERGADIHLMAKMTDMELERALVRVLNGEDFRLEIGGR